MDKSEKIILLLDDVSKTIIKTNVSTLIARKVEIISSLAELAKMKLEDIRTVIILEGFLRCGYALSDVKLYKALTGLEFLYLGSDVVFIESIKDIANVYQCDISLLSYEMIQAAMYSDSSFNVDIAKCSIEQDAVIAENVLQNYAGDEKVLQLARAFLALYDREQARIHEINVLKDRVKNYKIENDFLKKDNDRLLTSYSDLLLQAAELNSVLQQYEISFSKDIYTKLNLSNYVERPNIIYLKEYEDFLFLDELIETIFSALKIQNRQSVKVLRLYDSSDSNRIITLPSHYKFLGNHYLNSDVIANDYLCKSGDYIKVLEMLLFNKTNLDVLIIVDCKDFNDIVLNGATLQLNLCREPEHLDILHLSKENTIVNGSQEEYPDLLCWDSVNLAGKSKAESFMYLSSRKVIQRVLGLSRIFELAV